MSAAAPSSGFFHVFSRTHPSARTPEPKFRASVRIRTHAIAFSVWNELVWIHTAAERAAETTAQASTKSVARMNIEREHRPDGRLIGSAVAGASVPRDHHAGRPIGRPTRSCPAGF